MAYSGKLDAASHRVFVLLSDGECDEGSNWEAILFASHHRLDNLVVIVMIETLEGLKNADEIAKVPGIGAVFAASSDLGNFSGFKQGDPDYERAINIVHDAAIKAGKRLCGPLAWKDRPDFTCFQGGNETAAIARGVKAELGDLANTQPKPEVGPFASAK